VVRSGCAGHVLAQGHGSEEAHDVDGDDRCLEQSGADEPEGDRLVLPLEQREEHTAVPMQANALTMSTEPSRPTCRSGA